MTTHALNYQVGLLTSRDGYNVVGYHIVNFLFHLLATLALFLIIRYIFQKKINVEGMDPTLAGLFAGLFFGLHTINTETVVYISSRSASMTAMFYFLAFYGYLKATDQDGIKAWPLLFSTLSYAGGLLTKENAITFPAILFLYEWTLNNVGLRQMFEKKTALLLARKWWPSALMSLLYLGYRNILIGENLLNYVVSKGGTQASPHLTSQLATQARVWIYYIREWLLPTGLSIDKPFSVSYKFTEPKVAISILIIFTIAAVALYVRKRHPLVTFGVLFCMTTLLPETVIRLNVVLNDHRLYLPGLGATLILTYLCSILYVRFRKDGGIYEKVFVSLMVLVLFFMGIGTLKRNAAFATEETMWKDVILKDKNSVRGYNNLGIYYEQNKQFDKALRHYQKTIQLAPMFPNPYINIGNVYHKQKKYDQAERYMKRAIELDPRSALANYNLGNILREAKKRDVAIKAYTRALELNPRYIEAANNLANIYFGKKEYNQAIKYYEQALFIDPTFAMSFYNIALSHTNLGNFEEALESYNKFIYFWKGDQSYITKARQRIQSIQARMNK
jgi:tetratricopeptide (TPR) repeat protein